MSDNMTRVSLTEDYDDRSVISKLNKMSDIVDANTAKCDSAVTSAEASAQSAQRTADTFAGSVGAIVAEAKADIASSKTAVDQAKAEVDATVTTVAQAVQTANNASSVATQAAGQVTDKIAKTGTDTPQAISGTGGLQIAGDLDVGTDLSVAGQANIAGLAVESLGNAVKLSNDHGVNVNGHDLNNAVTTDEVQTITNKVFGETSNDALKVKSRNIDLSTTPTANKITYDYQIMDKNGKNIRGYATIHRASGTLDHRTYFVAPNGLTGFYSDATIGSDGVNYMTAPTPTSGCPSGAITTKGYVESTDGVTNNLVHRTAKETVDGDKTFNFATNKIASTTITSTSGHWVKVIKWTYVGLRYNIMMDIMGVYFRDVNFYGKLMFGCWDLSNFYHLDLYGKYDWSARFKLTHDGSEIALWYNNTNGNLDMGLNFIIEFESNGSTKTSKAIVIPEAEQVAVIDPDWTAYNKVLDCTFMGS